MSGLDKRPDTAVDLAPKYVGGIWITPNFVVSSTKKPNWFHRFMLKVLLGWEWRDTV